MARKKNQTTLFVIFAGPQQRSGPGTQYIAKDGSLTDIRTRAASFYTFQDAADFAKRNKIELTAHTYIGKEDFTDFELSQRN